MWCRFISLSQSTPDGVANRPTRLYTRSVASYGRTGAVRRRHVAPVRLSARTLGSPHDKPRFVHHSQVFRLRIATI